MEKSGNTQFTISNVSYHYSKLCLNIMLFGLFIIIYMFLIKLYFQSIR